MSLQPRLIQILAAATLALGIVLSITPSVSSQQKGRPRPVPPAVRAMPTVQPIRPLPQAQPSTFARPSINQPANAAAGFNALSPATNFGTPFSNGFAGSLNGGFGALGVGPFGFPGVGATPASGPGFVVASQSNPLLPLVSFPMGSGAGFGSGFGAFPGGFGSGFPVGVGGFPVGFGGNLGLGPVNNFSGFGAFPAVGGFAGKSFGFNGGFGL